MKGKLIVIEGTDCSGKETQADLLIDRLNKEGKQVERFSFPNYESPTGKIIGGAYLGKEHIGNSIFPEGATHVDPKVAALYYAADRKYNIHKISWLLENGIHVILDRYVYSNMAHQGCKINDKEERLKMYKWLDDLEFKLLELPKPDIAIFLHMPTEKVEILKANRIEALDEHEQDINYLKMAEKSYLELSDIYNFYKIECTDDLNIRSIDDISKDVYEFVSCNLQ